MTVKIGVNGFGRIGRNFFRAAKQRAADLDFVAVNDITDAPTLAHLLKYDSILGNLEEDVRAEGDTIQVAGRTIKVLAKKDPSQLPWNSTERLTTCFNRYWAGLNRNVDFFAVWLPSVAQATAAMLADPECRPL